MLVLDAELNSLSNGARFDRGHRHKKRVFAQILGFLLSVSDVRTIFEFFLPRFAQRLVLTLKVVVLDAELNSLSNGTRFDRGHRQKKGVFSLILGFSSNSVGKPCPDSFNDLC